MEAVGSFLDPCMSLDWSDFPELPFSSGNHKVQAVYVPDNRGGRLYVVLASKQDRKFCFCSLGSSPIKWHSDLSFVVHGFPIYDYTLTVYGSELVVIGGNFMGIPINLVWSLSSMQNEWKELPSMLTRRSSVMAVGYCDHLIAAGGKCGEKECSEVEVFNGKEWTKVKQLPCPLSSNELTSVLHSDKKWYIMATNGDSFRATYSIPIEGVISKSPTCEWEVYSPESCPPSRLLSPISFDGQLVVVGNNEKAKLYFHSPVTKSWVSFENAPFIGPYCNVVGIVSLPHKKALALIYNGSENYTVKVVTHKTNSQLHILDQHLSLSALIKLEYGHNIQVLSQLTPFRRRQLKQKAVFNLKPLSKEDKRMGTSDPAVNFYIDSWLQDESAGCCPTWRNFLVILRDIGMGEMAREICELFSKFPMTITPSSGTVAEELLKLQGSLSSVKYSCKSLGETEESQKVILPMVDHSLTVSCSVAWAARYAKHEALMRNESLLQKNKALLKNVNELQRKVSQEQRRIEQQKALDEKLTAEEHLRRLKTAIEQVGLQMQSQIHREKKIKSGVDQCINMCDVVIKRFADEKKLLDERIRHLEDELSKCQSHGSTDGDSTCSKATTALTERHIPSLFRQLKKHAAKWKDIGLHLGFLPSELDNIEAQMNLMQGAPLSFFGAMLQGWIQWAPEDSRGSTNFANMEDLKGALDEAGLAATAHALKL